MANAKVRSECTVMHRALVYSCVRVYDIKTDMLLVLQSKVQPRENMDDLNSNILVAEPLLLSVIVSCQDGTHQMYIFVSFLS